MDPKGHYIYSYKTSPLHVSCHHYTWSGDIEHGEENALIALPAAEVNGDMHS